MTEPTVREIIDELRGIVERPVPNAPAPPADDIPSPAVSGCEPDNSSPTGGVDPSSMIERIDALIDALYRLREELAYIVAVDRRG